MQEDRRLPESSVLSLVAFVEPEKRRVSTSARFPLPCHPISLCPRLSKPVRLRLSITSSHSWMIPILDRQSREGIENQGAYTSKRSLCCSPKLYSNWIFVAQSGSSVLLIVWIVAYPNFMCHRTSVRPASFHFLDRIMPACVEETTQNGSDTESISQSLNPLKCIDSFIHRVDSSRGQLSSSHTKQREKLRLFEKKEAKLFPDPSISLTHIQAVSTHESIIPSCFLVSSFPVDTSHTHLHCLGLHFSLDRFQSNGTNS